MRDMTSVLVVDDDPSVRALLRELLEDEGYRVGEAATGQVALDLLTHGTQPMVVLLDQSMPEMTGSEVVAAVSRDTCLRQQCACILRSGSAERLVPLLPMRPSPLV